MTLNLRRLIVGLVVLGALIVAYAFYAKLGGTPTVESHVQEPLPDQMVDSAAAGPNGAVGSIQGVSVERIAQTRFLHTNENNQVDREMGFEELLHKEGDQWGITNPFMKLFLPEFRCDVTADRGKFQLETAFDQLVPNDAVFEGNVVIHIIPLEPNDPKECFIYLDDVAFVAEKSLFSSAGSVRFISRSALLLGTGIELLYDSARSRMELFRIVDLDSLRLRSTEVSSLSSLTSQDRATRLPGLQGAAEPGDAVIATQPSEAERRDGGDRAGHPDPNAPAGDYYQCVFRENVTIETPDRIIIARERLSINNILWSTSAGEDHTKQDAAGGTSDASTYPARDALDTTAPRQLTLDSLPEELFDIVVTCDAGFAVMPVGASHPFSDPSRVTSSETSPDDLSEEATGIPDRQRAIARRIDFDVPTGDTTLLGPVEMTFYLDPNDPTGREAAGELMPVTVTAQDAVRFSSALNQILLEGDCVATIHRTEPNLSYEYTLTAPVFTLDLADDANDQTNGSAVVLERFATGGGSASLAVVKRAGQVLAGWTALQASRLDYDATDQLFTATGPGVVTIHNARPRDPKADPNESSFLDQPCYAFLRDFDTLTFSSATYRVLVEADPGPILIDYFPVIDGQAGPSIEADAGHIELALRQTSDGRMELASLTASKGVFYEDETKRFVGSRLTYDHDKTLVRVVGDESQPCYLNRALVDEVEMDTKTRNVKAKSQAPSVFQVNP